jgi:hypothetical protein
MMATHWHNTNFDTTFDILTQDMDSVDSFDEQFNVNWEIIECLEIVYEILDDLEDIEIALWKGKDPSHILSPPFDPFETIGKYR